MTIDAQTATVTIADETLDVKSLRVKMDRSWSPFVQGQATLPVALDIDPKAGIRARVTMRQVFGESAQASELSTEFTGMLASDVSALWAGMTAAEVSAEYFTPWNSFGVRGSTSRFLDLTVRKASTNARARETVLELASDEADAQGFILVQSVAITFGTFSVRSIVSQVLAKMGARLLAGTADGTLEATATWEPGVAAWAFLAPLVQQAGLRLWCDGRRAWRLESDDQSPVGGITLSSRDTLTDATIDADIDNPVGWADAVVIVYKWRDSNGVNQTKYDVAGDPKPRHGVTLTYDDTPYPGPGAATQVLRRRQRRGKVIPVDAVSTFEATPDMSFLVAIDGIPQQSGTIQSVEWRLPQAEMTVESAGLEEINPQGIKAIPASYRIIDLPGTIASLVPGDL